jgi:hypothetical protein
MSLRMNKKKIRNNKNKRWNPSILSYRKIHVLRKLQFYSMPRAEIIFLNEPNKPKFIKALN